MNSFNDISGASRSSLNDLGDHQNDGCNAGEDNKSFRSCVHDVIVHRFHESVAMENHEKDDYSKEQHQKTIGNSVHLNPCHFTALPVEKSQYHNINIPDLGKAMVEMSACKPGVLKLGLNRAEYIPAEVTCTQNALELSFNLKERGV